jgi:hypothetical protein
VTLSRFAQAESSMADAAASAITAGRWMRVRRMPAATPVIFLSSLGLDMMPVSDHL